MAGHDATSGYQAEIRGNSVVITEFGDRVVMEERIDCDLDALRAARMQNRMAHRLLIRTIEEIREDEAGPKFIINVVAQGLDIVMDERRPLTKRHKDAILQALGGTHGAIGIPMPGSDDDEAMYVVPIRKIDYVSVFEKKPPKERTGW